MDLDPIRIRGEFPVLPEGEAEAVLTGGLPQTNEIYGPETFAMVAAIVAFGRQLGGSRVALFIDNNGPAGALIKASSRALSTLVPIESFWESVAQLSAS